MSKQNYIDRRVDMRSLKKFALNSMPRGSHLRELILSDRDSLTPEEFVVRVELWLKLYDIENNKG